MLTSGDFTRRRRMNVALIENRKLRAILQDRLRVADAFERVIDKHVRLTARRLPWPINASDEFIFAMLEEGKELQFAATDEVLEASGVARAERQLLSRLHFQRDSFHHAEVQVLPFNVLDVTSAVQNCLAHGETIKSSRQKRFHRVMQDNDHFKAVTVDQVRVLGALPAQVTARLIQWCVVQPERSVIAWSGLIEYDGCRYIRMLEKIWVSIEPILVKSNSGKVEKQGSILRVVVRLTPLETEFNLEDAESIGEMVDVITALHHRNAEFVYQTLLEQLGAIPSLVDPQ